LHLFFSSVELSDKTIKDCGKFKQKTMSYNKL